MSAYKLLFEQVLARTDPEWAHGQAFSTMRAAEPFTRRLLGLPQGTRATRRVMGLDVPGVLGLAAGFDKSATGIDALAGMGFAFVEVGTVTGEPQDGNPRPRLVRLPQDRAIVNRMGFNNDGAEVVAERLEQRRRLRAGRPSVPVGINIGKSKVVPEGHATADYEKSTTLLAPHADYLVVNVSSPNTPGLRDLQAVERLGPLMEAVRRRADDVAARRVPLLVKIAPDLSDDDVLAVADLAGELGLDGIVATNTTVAREALASPLHEIGAVGPGGLSGPPLRVRSLEVLRLLRGRVAPSTTLIAVGGISTVAEARARLEAGADLLQAYTAFVYEGPLWPRRTNQALAAVPGGAAGLATSAGAR